MRTSCGVARSRIEDSIAFTQPDLPAPVVPATSRCGILARSAPIARPATSLPSHTVSGDQSEGGAWKTSPRCTIRRRVLGTSTPTACLPGIGARMRMSEAASAYARSSLSCATLPTFVPGASRSS